MGRRADGCSTLGGEFLISEGQNTLLSLQKKKDFLLVLMWETAA